MYFLDPGLRRGVEMLSTQRREDAKVAKKRLMSFRRRPESSDTKYFPGPPAYAGVTNNPRYCFAPLL